MNFPKDWTKYDTVEFSVECQAEVCAWKPPYINNHAKGMHEATQHHVHTGHKVVVQGVFTKWVGNE